MSKERELLERALREWDERYGMGEWETIFEEIRDYLAAEPVAWMLISTVGSRHYHMSEQQALKGLQMYGGKVIALYDHPVPRKKFVRLSEEEIQEVIEDLLSKETWNWMMFARAIQDALEEKNR